MFLEQLRHLGGLKDGKAFYITPDWVDKSKKPGHSKFPTPTFQDFVWDGFVFQKHLFFSPNLIWLLITVVMYFVFPYNLENSPANPATIAPVSVAFFRERFPIWFVLVFGYVGFWHVTLHILKWGDRPFVANRKYKLAKTIHNAYYNIYGIIVLVAVENIFCFLYSTGRLSFYTDSEVKSSTFLHLATFYWISTIPLWRDFHFYFAHRLIHYDALYRYIHALHHRNTDIEPFAGESMHPIEHIYYYASYLPLLFIKHSPFVMLWNLVHLVLAPAASHSGEESAFQSDSFHYLHHRFFTFNYAGLGASFLDATFGSFLPQWPQQNEQNEDHKTKRTESTSASYSEDFLTQHDAKATLWGLPTFDVILYNIFGVGTVLLGLAGASNYLDMRTRFETTNLARSKFFVFLASALGLSSEQLFFGWILCGFGPVIVAYLLNAKFAKNFRERTANDKSLMHTLIHVGAGCLCCPISFAMLVSMCF